MLEHIYHTIRGTKSPRALETNSEDPLSAAKPFLQGHEFSEFCIPIMENRAPTGHYV